MSCYSSQQPCEVSDRRSGGERRGDETATGAELGLCAAKALALNLFFFSLPLILANK